jgi:hypothetical protein
MVGIPLVLLLLTLVAAPPAQAAVDVTPKCSIAPEDCSGWFRSDVSLTWIVTPSDATKVGCEDKAFDAETAGTTASCTADDGSGPVTKEVVIRVDKTPPVVGDGLAVRGPDAGDWYNAPVTIAFTGEDAMSGLGACPPIAYQGPDGVASVVGTCSDVAGNTGSSTPFSFNYDATGPEVTAAVPERLPDRAGWYTAPVRFSVLGADATSGLAECPPVTYAGPDAAAASVVGTCRDRAGNQSSRAFELMYDVTPPPISHLTATPGDQRAALRWQTTPDATFVEVLRVPGRESESASVVFRGPGSSFQDDKLRNGVRYVYRVRLADPAGNESVATAAAVPSAPSPDPPGGSGQLRSGPTVPASQGHAGLLRPRANAKVTAGRPLLFTWTPIARARYYNVQLYRGKRKILSVWPARPRYRLERQWSFAGKPRRLSRGRYRWYVWPGYGRRAKSTYGDLVGRRDFKAVRASASG